MNSARKIALCLVMLGQSWLLDADEFVIPTTVRPEDYMPPFNTNLVHQEQEENSKESLKKIENIVQHAVKEHEEPPVNQRLLQPPVENVQRIDQERALLLDGVYKDPMLLEKKISVHIKKISIKKAIDLINKLSGVMFVVDPDVSGIVEEFKVENVSLAVALQLMLNSSHPRLALVNTFGVWRIMHHTFALELLKAQEYERAALDSSSAIYTVQHAKFDDQCKIRLEKLWDGVIGDMKGKPGFYIAFDDGSKKIFFKGRSGQVEDFKKMLEEIDVEVPQVRLDVRVVIADKSFDETLGFQWSGRYDRAMKTRHLEFASLGAKQFPVSTRMSGEKPTVESPFGAITDWSLNLIPGWRATDTVRGFAKQSGMFSIPFIFRNADYTKLLNLTLNAAEDRQEIKTILKPSLLVNSDETAEILVGESMPLQVQVAESIGSNITNVSTTQYKEIGIKVNVKPVVSIQTNSVFLDIFLENSSLSVPTTPISWQQNSTTQTIGYTILTARSKNRVLLRSGQTTLISGLITNLTRSSQNGIPYLRDIPIFGNLFRGSKKTIEDKQLLIFITPVVV